MSQYQGSAVYQTVGDPCLAKLYNYVSDSAENASCIWQQKFHKHPVFMYNVHVKQVFHDRDYVIVMYTVSPQHLF